MSAAAEASEAGLSGVRRLQELAAAVAAEVEGAACAQELLVAVRAEVQAWQGSPGQQPLLAWRLPQLVAAVRRGTPNCIAGTAPAFSGCVWPWCACQRAGRLCACGSITPGL